MIDFFGKPVVGSEELPQSLNELTIHSTTYLLKETKKVEDGRRGFVPQVEKRIVMKSFSLA
jgi:hypothetical protein